MFIEDLAAAAAAEHYWAAAYGPGSGRFGAVVAAVVAVISLLAGSLALTRSTRRPGAGRVHAVSAQAIGSTGMVLAVWHIARSADGFGTGNGRAGAIVAAVLALTGIVLGGFALWRTAGRADPPSVITAGRPR